MKAKTFFYPLTIKETHLDTFGHVNNATYLSLLEEARWELMNENHYGIEKITQSGLGPTILEINIQFLRELHARDKIIIETKLISYHKKIGVIEQKMIRDKMVCCEAKFVIALFSLKERKLVLPTNDWLQTIGVEME